MNIQHEVQDNMSSTDQSVSEPKEDNSYSLLSTNDLVYILPPDLSVSVNQTHKNQFFQSSSYTDNQRGICIFNTGADYGDLRNSSLEFGVNWTGANNACLAYLGRNGSILNLIKSITISSRSGDELARIQDFNLLSYHRNQLKWGKEFFNTVGQGMGQGTTLIPDNHLLANTNAEYLGVQRFSIPMYMLTDFFSYSRLMPAQVLSGLRVEIEWARPAEAFISYATTTAFADTHPAITTYTIDNPYFAIRSVQLTDATQRALNELSATNGLELVYCDYERTDSVQTTNQFHMEIRKACSRALQAMMITRVSANTSDLAHDSLKSEAWDTTQWQFQLGSLYYPQQPVQTSDTTASGPHQILPETYKHALIAFDKYKCLVPGKTAALPLYTHPDSGLGSTSKTTHPGLIADSGHTYGKISPAYGSVDPTLDTKMYTVALLGIDESLEHPYHYGTFAAGNSCIATTLERSDLFNLSGVPINNARVLAVRSSYTTTVSRQFTAFLKYVRLARVFLNNVEVEQ